MLSCVRKCVAVKELGWKPSTVSLNQSLSINWFKMDMIRYDDMMDMIRWITSE